MPRDTPNLDEAVESAVEGTIGEQLVQVVRAEGSDGDEMIRPFLILDLRSALRSLRGTDTSVPGIGEAADAATELASDSGSQQDESGGRRTGRGLLSSLFLAGIVVGVGYALRNRGESASPDEAAEQAAEEAQTIAERAASTIQQRGEVAAERIEESTGAIAERIEETGQETADQLDEASDQIEGVQEQASDAAEDVQEDVEETVEDAQEGAEETAEEMESEEETDEETDDDSEF